MKKWLLASLLSTLAFAEETTPVLNSGDTAWMMISTALVMLMTPIGLALFYAGMTRAKNVLNTYLMVFGAFTILFIAWVIAGFSIGFGTMEGSLNQFIGGFSHIMLSGISWSDLSAETGQTYPKFVFIVFQGTFAAITIAIAAGSVIERMKFSTWMIFAFIWTFVFLRFYIANFISTLKKFCHYISYRNHHFVPLYRIIFGYGNKIFRNKNFFYKFEFIKKRFC
jgi:Amt family ammonium transporter